MHASWVLSLPDHVSIEESGSDGLTIASPFGQTQLQGFHADRRHALCQLADPGRTLEQLLGELPADPASGQRARLLRDLRALTLRGLLHFHVQAGDRRIATLAPMADSFEFPRQNAPSGRFMLSRFAYLHFQTGGMLLESPRSAARIVLHDPAVTQLMHALASPCSLPELCAEDHGLSEDALVSLICLLANAQMLAMVDEAGQQTDEDQPGLKYWSFHDLLFHAGSRIGRHDQNVGAALHWVGVEDPPPATKPASEANSLPLVRPDMAELQQRDPSLTQALEQRCSVRTYGQSPLTKDQLAEFLYRVARVKDTYSLDLETTDGPIPIELTKRPYPSAGGLYELELYALVQSCDGLATGLYHYDAVGHQLTPLPCTESVRAKLVQLAGSAAGEDPQSLQVVLFLSARFPRVMWKYSSMAYSAILKNVGVLYQSMYLVATSMGLAPCALGAGNSDLFSQAIGSDYYDESSVGEFLLGSLPKQENI